MHVPLPNENAPVADVKSLPVLRDIKRANPNDWRRFQAMEVALPDQDTLTLILRLESVTDPLQAWSIHRELDRRDIPPILRRWHQDDESPQIRLIRRAVDVAWFIRHNPTRLPHYSSWMKFFNRSPDDDRWQESFYQVHRYAERGKGAAHFAKALGLSERDRRDLATIKTTGQIARLRPLKQAEEYRMAILSYAKANPDRSGNKTPEAISRRRFDMWRLFILADGSETEAARYYELLYGERVARQNLGKQVQIVKKAWQEYGPHEDHDS